MRDRVPSWLRYFRFWGADPDKEIGEEFHFHLATEIEELIARGVPPAEARTRALTQFGDVERAAAECRAADSRRLGRIRRARLLETIRHDVTYTVRGLAARPGFTGMVVLTLTLGVGANAAVFTIADRVFLRPPAGVDDPGSLRRLYNIDTRFSNPPTAEFRTPEALDVVGATAREFAVAMYIHEPRTPVELSSGDRHIIGAAWVTPGFLRVLGVRPARGRDLIDDDLRLGEPGLAAIVSWRFWRDALGGEDAALGRTIRVHGNPVTIVGIAPRGFSGIDLAATDIWLPMSGYTGIMRAGKDWWTNRGFGDWLLITRVSDAAAAARFIARGETAMRIGVREYRERAPQSHLGDPDARIILGSIIAAQGPEKLTHEMSISVVLIGVAALVLVIAAANAGNLLLGRALQRRRETALRLALGIRPRRLVGQILLESLLIAVAAAASATLVAVWVGGALRSMLLPDVEWAGSPVDLRIALFALVVALGGGVLAGLVAARETLRVDMATVLKGTVRDGGGRRSGLRGALVTVQATLSLILLVGTGLFARTLYNIRNIDLGYDVPGLVVASSDDRAVAEKIPEVIEIARSLPGVVAVSGASASPFDRPYVGVFLTSDGDTLPLLRDGSYAAVEPTYHATVGTRIVRGRALSPGDDAAAPRAMIVSESAERLLFGGRSALGRCVHPWRRTYPCYTIVGVSKDPSTRWLLREPGGTVAWTLAQAPQRPIQPDAMVVRVRGDPAQVIERLRTELGDTLPWLAERTVRLMSEELAPQYRPWQLGARLFAGFAALALLLAGLGLYSVLAYVVALRRHEIGVRIALGATQSRVIRLVVGDGIRYAAAGGIAGTAIVLAGAGPLAPLLYQVSARDPAVIVGAVVVMLLGAIAAALLPARRAVGVDPMLALRDE